MDLLKGANRMHIQMTRDVVDATPEGMVWVMIFVKCKNDI